MNFLSLQASAVKVRLHESLRQAFTDSENLKAGKHKIIYRCGDQASDVYFIERGLIKLMRVSREGKACSLAVLTAGDVFGELCLSGASQRLETAIAMEETILRQISFQKFLVHLNTDALFADFVSYLVVRMAEQENTIASLMTLDSQHRLGEILMQLAGKIGRPTSNGLCIDRRITHEELSEMVGTTRPRITEFLRRFRKLGLVDVSSGRCLMVKNDRLTRYLRTH